MKIKVVVPNARNSRVPRVPRVDANATESESIESGDDRSVAVPSPVIKVYGSKIGALETKVTEVETETNPFGASERKSE